MRTVPKPVSGLAPGDIIARHPDLDAEVAWTVVAEPAVIRIPHGGPMDGTLNGTLMVTFVKPDDEFEHWYFDYDETVQVQPPEVAERAAKIAGARQMLDYLEATPDVPLPWRGLSITHFVRDGLDDARMAEVDRIAELLGAKAHHTAHYQVELTFGSGAEYQAIACDIPNPDAPAETVSEVES